MTSKPLVRRTLATFRSAEFGFFGVVVYTRVQTPRFCGQPCSAGTVLRTLRGSRPLAISWLMVGIDPLSHPNPVRPTPDRAGRLPQARPAWGGVSALRVRHARGLGTPLIRGAE